MEQEGCNNQFKQKQQDENDGLGEEKLGEQEGTEMMEITEHSQGNQFEMKRTVAGQNQPEDESKMFIASPQTEVQITAVTDRSFGNNILLYDSKRITLTLGPDYLCFIPTFLVFCAISFLLITFVNNNADSLIGKIVTHIVCIGECLAYLMVAISDPGIAQPKSVQELGAMAKTSFCRKCRFQVPKSSFHCNYCNVCIVGYDHHCPWTSKCIGHNNLYKFYAFLFMTPIFIVYCAFAFAFTVQPVQNHHKSLTIHKL